MGALKWYNETTSSWEYVEEPGGANSWVFKEAISGVNGTATAFTTARGYIPNTLQVFVNGIAQGPTHISETTPSTGSFSLDVAPESGATVTANYQINIPAAGNADTLDGYHASQSPSASQVPVLDGSGDLNIGGDVYSNGSRAVTEAAVSEDFTSSVSFVETPANTSFRRTGNYVNIAYQGDIRTRGGSFVMFTLPVGYRPAEQIMFPMVVNASAYGYGTVNTDGTVMTNVIGSFNGRAVFQVGFFVS